MIACTVANFSTKKLEKPLGIGDFFERPKEDDGESAMPPEWQAYALKQQLLAIGKRNGIVDG